MPTEGANSIAYLDPANPDSNAAAGEGDDQIRQLKSVLQTSFPALDGLISNVGATGDPGDVDPPDAATYSRLFTDVRAAASAAIPLGGIIMWAGTEAQIPTGWALCNGLSGTPDLRDKFILGSDDSNSQYTTGQSGGQGFNDVLLPYPVLLTTTSPDDTATVNADTGTTNVQSNVQSHTHYYLPPFYALAYIQYVGT